MAVATTSRPRVPVLARPTQAELRRSQWTWLAGGLALAFSIPFVLTDLVSIDRDLYYGVFVGAVFAFAGAWLRFGVASPRRAPRAPLARRDHPGPRVRRSHGGNRPSASRQRTHPGGLELRRGDRLARRASTGSPTA